MGRKSGLEVKKLILQKLAEKECSLRELETKTNTGYTTIKRHCEELEFLRVVEIVKHKKNAKNGRPYTTVMLTEEGIKLNS